MAHRLHGGLGAGTSDALLHRWAVADPGRRFDDVFNLVYDPAFLAAAWDRVDQHRRPHCRGRSDRTAVDHLGPGSEHAC